MRGSLRDRPLRSGCRHATRRLPLYAMAFVHWPPTTMIYLQERHHLRAFHDAPVPLDELVDAPVYAGRPVRKIDLAPAGEPPVHLYLLADAPAQLRVPADEIARLRALSVQTARLFRSSRDRRDETIASLSDRLQSRGGTNIWTRTRTLCQRTISPISCTSCRTGT